MSNNSIAKNGNKNSRTLTVAQATRLVEDVKLAAMLFGPAQAGRLLKEELARTSAKR